MTRGYFPGWHRLAGVFDFPIAASFGFTGCFQGAEILKIERGSVKAIIVIFALLFLVGMCSSNPPPVPTKTPEQIKATKERDIKLNKVIAGAYTLKKAARNPDSFKLTSAMVMDNGASCYEYRAQNGFGGMNVGSAVMHNGDIIMNESVGFVKKWNKVCAKQPGVEFKEDVNIAFEILDSVHPKTITY